jgi:ribosome maturation factor RimP
MSEHLPPPIPQPAVRDLVERTVAELGLDLDALELRGTGPKRTLRIVIDADGGVSLDVVTQATRELSREFDRSEVMGSVGYTLEVTSRGLDRPLTLARHWVRNIGRLVVVTTTGDERLRARIVGADDIRAQLDDGTEVTYADVKSAVIEPELNRRAERNS